MKQSEKRALEAYPQSAYEPEHFVMSAPGMCNGFFRKVFQQGYELAEKDLGWHSVDESLPPVDEEVIVLRDELNGYLLPDAGFVGVGHIVNPELTVEVGDISYTPISYSGWNIDGVKYWMPIPKLPEEDEK